MKITKLSLYFLTLATGCLIMLSSCNKENISTSVTEENGEIELKSGNNGPSANGQGTFSWGLITRHISFHANTMPQGNIKGNGVLTWNAGANWLNFDIDCLSIDDNTAIVTGIITRSRPTYSHQVGLKFWFKVADNGEGSNSNPDQVTWLYFIPDYEDCNIDYGYEFHEIEGGNIQVKP